MTLEQVKDSHPEVLFYKVPRQPGSDLFYFKSYLPDKQRILGFDQYGNPLNTAQVQPDQLESQFSMISNTWLTGIEIHTNAEICLFQYIFCSHGFAANILSNCFSLLKKLRL